MTSWPRRHKVITSLLSMLTLFLALVLGFALWLNSSLGDVERIPLTVAEDTRPVETPSEDLNILLLGTDAGSERNTDGRGIVEDAASGTWPTGKYRSDATMVVNIAADRKTVTVMSIPRDSYVEVHDDSGRPVGKNKINAALSLYGPNGALATVESLTDVRIDHLVMLDWDGFRGITDALGGVTMTTDVGTQKYSGQEALDYVSQRKTVAGGDLGRIKRQQNFMRAVLRGTLATSTVTNPVTLRRTVSSVTQNIAVDDAWSNGDIRSLAFSLSSLRADDIRFLTVPTAGTATDPNVGSIVRLDTAGFGTLFAAVRDDALEAYVAGRGDLLLPSASSID